MKNDKVGENIVAAEEHQCRKIMASLAATM